MISVWIKRLGFASLCQVRETNRREVIYAGEIKQGDNMKNSYDGRGIISLPQGELLKHAKEKNPGQYPGFFIHLSLNTFYSSFIV